MKNKIVIFMLCSIVSLYSQSRILMRNFKPSNTEVMQRLEKIYRNLEYNTKAFDDLKNKWVVTDPLYVREIFNKFIVNNGLMENGIKITKDILDQKIVDIYNGTVFVELRKRYYDNEIEELRFFTESKFEDMNSMIQTKRDYFFDPITDNIYIRSVLGDEIYKDLANQFYAHTDLTKEPFGNKEAYNFDIKLDFFNPEVMFWSQTTKGKNKYLVSFFSKWGNNNILFPGWYYPDVFLGVKMSYIEYIKNNEPYHSYYFEIGTGLPVRFPSFEFNTDQFGTRLFHTGNNIYSKLSGNPLMLISKDLENFEFTFEGLFSITEYSTKKFNLDYSSQFFSNRNFLGVHINYSDIFNVFGFGWFYAGVGYSNYDIYHYLLDNDKTDLIMISRNLNHLLQLEIGLKNLSGMLQHDISPIINYNFTSSYGYAGIKTKFMINNIVGLEFVFMTVLGEKSSLPFYRVPSYILFTPIIRINY